MNVMSEDKKRMAKKSKICYPKGNIIAVKNTEGSFYLCKVLNDVYSTNKKVKVQWLENSSKQCDTYKIGDFDKIPIGSILGEIHLKKLPRNKYRLESEYKSKIQSWLFDSLSTTNTTCPSSQVVLGVDKLTDTTLPDDKDDKEDLPRFPCQKIQQNEAAVSNLDLNSHFKHNKIAETSNAAFGQTATNICMQQQIEPPDTTTKCDKFIPDETDNIHDRQVARIDSIVSNPTNQLSQHSTGDTNVNDLCNNLTNCYKITLNSEENNNSSCQVLRGHLLQPPSNSDITSTPEDLHFECTIQNCITNETRVANETHLEHENHVDYMDDTAFKISMSVLQSPDLQHQEDENSKQDTCNETDALSPNRISQNASSYTILDSCKSTDESQISADIRTDSQMTPPSLNIAAMEMEETLPLSCEIGHNISTHTQENCDKSSDLLTPLCDSTDIQSDTSSDDEYNPDSDNTSKDESEDEYLDCNENMNSSNKSYKRHAKEHKQNAAVKQSRFSKNGIAIPKARHNRKTGIRTYDKRQYCFFCSKPYLKIARHLLSVHQNESEVAKVMALKVRSAQRQLQLEKLCNLGNFYHNMGVLSTGHGELVLLRRPLNVSTVSPWSYGPCPDCLGMLHKKHLWIHAKKCHFKDRDSKCPITRKRQFQAESSAIMLPFICENLSSEFRTDILQQMKNDEITMTIQHDPLILQHGMLEFEKYGCSQRDLIRQNMRMLARLMLQIQSSDPANANYKLNDVIKPETFDTIVEAVKSMCQTNENGHVKFNTPSFALKIGYNLRKIANILIGNSLRSHDTTLCDTAKSFISLYELEWNTRISSKALSSMVSEKQNKTMLLPLTADLQKLNKHQLQEIIKQSEELAKFPTKETWQKLCTATLSRLILFNKRRGGEASKMTLMQYSQRPDWSTANTEELQSSLTEFEKKLCNRLSLVEITGKRNRTVPIVLTPEVKKGIDLLSKYRVSIGINPGNPYVFARVYGESTRNVRGSDVLRRSAEEAGLQNPSLVRSTKLRKYVSTVCQLFNLTEAETDWLARHLGHDIRVHRDFYRLHESAIELAKVSRLLIAVDKGVAHNFAGKKLDDINVEELTLSCNEEENAEDDSENSDDGEPLYEATTSDAIEKNHGSDNNKNKSLPSNKGKQKKVKGIKKMWSNDEEVCK